MMKTIFTKKKISDSKNAILAPNCEILAKLKIYGYAAKLKKLFAQNSKNELAAKFKYINEF